MAELLAVVLITLLAVISPGPDFAMVTRNSYANGRRNGLASALGIALGVQVHVCYTVLGIALWVAQNPALLLAMKVGGAGYLIWLGVQSLRNTSRLTLSNDADRDSQGLGKAFTQGFLTNALNPKTMLFVVATYTQVVKPNASLLHAFGYGAFMSAAHWLWFSLVALFFSAGTPRRWLLSRQWLFDKVIGSALVGLGATLLIPSGLHV